MTGVHAVGNPSSSVVADISTYLICGRMQSTAPDDPRTGRSVAQGINDARVAEQLGFRRAFISERLDIKDAGAFLGGAAAVTSRLEVGTGALAVPSRDPRVTASLGATMHAAYGPRFILGLGRTEPQFMSYGQVSFDHLIDYAGIIRRLWRGESVSYHGPAGDFDDIALRDLYDGPPPEIWSCILGGPRAARAAARAFDGVILTPYLLPEAVARTVGFIREECDRIGRDPAEIRICHPIVTAPDLDDYETRLLAHARAVTYFQMPSFARALSAFNGWDGEGLLAKFAEHQQLAGVASADQSFHRRELLGPASLIPDAWMQQTCALGTVDSCVKTLQQFRDAGVDELAFYGSTPDQNAELLDAWRQRSRAVGVEV
ncbi:TIGR03857 family LLM class F420-dependent oxidoreductase [Mycobacterium sp.]|uniref:TIGR03857 family LLM class F420-dependent oxidoreductase n=1 Tax=Mycobacterium sp. TaxID=1785 RepID=UPI0011F4A7B4|nr:TIGR03857 family LLM class F420-dependent oxidoreductase [Mycobacterium sp.]TAM70246.1 MAG: TIGR03857 family LLM class F420-dependent oxidoreductase [Mycobacterium sp.]